MLQSLASKQRAEACYVKGKALLAAIGVERAPTDTERADIDALNADMSKHLADAKRFETIEAMEAGRKTGVDTSELGKDLAELDAQGKPKSKVVQVFQTLGHQLRSIYAVQTNQVQGYDGITLEEHRNRLVAAASGSNEVVDSEGGFALQSDFSAGIERNMYEMGDIMKYLTPIDISSESNQLVERFIDETSRATGSRWGAVRAYWLAEAGTMTPSQIKLDQMKTELQKLAALGYMTDETMRDASALTGIYSEAFRDELVFMTEDAVFEGDGAGKPFGAFHAQAPGTLSIAKESGQPGLTIVPENLSNMWARLLKRSKAKAIWYCNGDAMPALDKLALAVGTAALEPRFVTYGPDGILRIKGRPVVELEYCSTLGTKGDIVLADWSGYRFIRKGGVQQATSIHVRFLQNETAFRAVYRVGGQPKAKKPLTPFKGSKTLSSFIQLDDRA